MSRRVEPRVLAYTLTPGGPTIRTTAIEFAPAEPTKRPEPKRPTISEPREKPDGD